MGWWSLLSGRGRRSSRNSDSRKACLRRGRFEALEERRLLAADPLRIGVTYVEEDSGSDLHGDTFQILFEGGAPGTELTQVVISGDHGPAGLSVGDMIFDTTKGGLGADEAFNLQVVSSTGIQNVTWQLSDGGMQLTFNFQGFHAGEKLVFTVDVDEVQEFNPAETNQPTINEGIDPIASGVEFQGSKLTAKFHAPHYHQVQGTSDFRNLYDPLFGGSNLLVTQGNPGGLPNDDFQGKRDRSTGTMLSLQQLPLPVTIAGKVFADNDSDLSQDSGEPGLAGVTLTLFTKVGGVWQGTGHTTLTDAQGRYKFGLELNLQPGVYQVRETQPAGYFSIGAIPGNVSGTPTGATIAGDPDVLTEINIPLGDLHGVNYDFAEAQPASIRGRVHLTDRNGDCFSPEALNRPLAGVKITLKDAQGNIVGTTLTGANGEYEFTNLMPGTYTLVEETPPGLLDGGDHIGTIGGIPVGVKSANDTISQITLGGGQDAVDYDFCEKEPAMVAGFVYYDRNNNGLFDSGEAAISGTTIVLLDAGGQQVAQTTSDSTGFYKFANLSAGNYTIREVQPAGFIDGKDSPGTIAGVVVGTADSAGDRIHGVNLLYGDSGVNYNFGELKAGTIAGRVWVDPDRDLSLDSGETPLAGVTIQLLDAGGNVIRTTQTNEQGEYRFDNLAPGVYAVREVQPAGYLQGGQKAGSHGGDASVTDLITQLIVMPEENLVDYDFCELPPPGSISGYVFRDGGLIFSTDGKPPANLAQLRDGKLTSDDLRLKGVVLELRHTLTGEPVLGEECLPGTYPPGPVRVRTDANGFYQFKGLPAGNYSVFEVHPEGYIDSIDTPGSTDGIAVNPGTLVSPLVVQTFALQGVSFKFDAILQIPLAAGQHSVQNNFSEVQVAIPFLPLELEAPPELPVITEPEFQPPPIIVFPEVFTPPKPQPIVTGGASTFTWHLSVIDAGLPRMSQTSTLVNQTVWRPALFVDGAGWQASRLREGIWTIHTAHEDGQPPAPVTHLFGTRGAIPVVGDWNGDGRSELGLFFNGEWFLDLNGNGQWDAEDLWAKLGDNGDRPVVGDWDGDGKDDIGVFGAQWSGDARHLESEPGLPDSANGRVVLTPEGQVKRPKNWPPTAEQATDGARQMRLTAQGQERADLIDHVLAFGGSSDTPIAGDWNGDGIRSVGVFRDGRWYFDMDGDGRWSAGDLAARFGQEGDIPFVGDFDGDGIEEIGVYRAGRWIIDSNGNRQIDQEDRQIELGGEEDVPVVGDWNGDGIDDPGLYREEVGPAGPAGPQQAG